MSYKIPITAFVTLSDESYFPRARRTIEDLRTQGQWEGPIIFIAVDFQPPQDFLHQFSVILFKTRHISTDALVKKLRANPLGWTNDNRHFGKLYQWDKLQVFLPYFKQWDRIVFLDAGLRVFGTVTPLLELPQWRGKIVAPDDSDPYDNRNRFGCQLRLAANPPVADELFQEFPRTICDEHYFLNCIFMFDTALIKADTFTILEDAMNRFPICGTNEMTIMNLFFTFRWRVWEPMPQKTAEGKYLFGWSELNYHERPTYRAFHFIKYPVTC